MGSCSIIRNKQTGEIEKVLAPNGESSILWDSIINDGRYANNQEAGIRIWAKAYTATFKQQFGDWELMNEAVTLADKLKDPQKQMFLDNPEQFLFEKAQQLNSDYNTSKSVQMALGQRLSEIASLLFPDAQEGDIFESKFEGKVDKNWEPLHEELQKSGIKSTLLSSLISATGDVQEALRIYRLTQTPEFKKWFEGSVVVDDNGEPLIVYHGTDTDFSEFDKELRGTNTGKSTDGSFDSEHAFFFTDNKNVAFNYSIIGRQEELLHIITSLDRITSTLYSNKEKQERYDRLRADSPKFAEYVDALKAKGLSSKEITANLRDLYNKYYKLYDLTKGGAISNSKRFYNDTEDGLEKLRENKQQILSGVYEPISKHGPGYSWTTSTGYDFLTISSDGQVFYGLKNINPGLSRINGKNITQLTSSEFDELMSAIEETIKEGRKREAEDIKRGGFTPKMIVGFLSIKNPISEDFKGSSFVEQMPGYQEGVPGWKTASDLAKRAVREGRDGFIFHNIADPEKGNTFGVFNSNQIKSINNSGEFSQSNNIFFSRTSGNYKEVLSAENQKIFKELIGQGLITERRWKGMYFIPKQRHEIIVSGTFRGGRTDYRDGYFVADVQKYRQLKAIIEARQLGWLDVEETKKGGSFTVKIFPDRQTATQQRFFRQVGNEAFRNIADRLSQRLGIPYKVIDAQEAIQITRDSNIPWNGEGAFAYKGTVYVLQDATTLDNGIHEFAHFFVKAVATESPYLIEKLRKQFEADPTAKSRYVDFVNEMYPEFSEADKTEEMLVRAITDKALGMVDEATGNVILDAVRKIWRTLTNIIRNLFGVSVKNLDENTTVDQLAAILLGDKQGEVIDLGDRNTSLFTGLFPMYNREMANELEKLTTSTIKTSIDSFFTVVNEHWNRIREDRDLSKLREVLSNDKESTLVKDERELLKLAKKFSETLEENSAVDRATLTAFAEAIEGQEVIAKRMADHVADFDKVAEGEEPVSNQDKLAIFRKYSFIAREWGKILKTFNEHVEDSPVGRGKNALSDSIQNIQKNYEYINNKIKKFYKNDGLVTVFREELQDNIYYQASIADQKARVAQLEADYTKLKTPALARKLEKERDLLRRYELTDETISNYLAGEMGDTNYYSMYLESYTSNPDPIVGTFTNWFLKQKFKAQVRAQERLTNFNNVIGAIYKKLGFNQNDFKKVAENLVERQKMFDKYENYEASSKDVWHFINQYSNGWEYEYNRLREEMENARSRQFTPIRGKGYENQTGEEEYRAKRKAFEQFKLDYMFDEENDKVKEARLFWFRDANTLAAKQAMDDIWDKMRKNSFTDISNDEALEKKDENKDLWREYRQLSSLTDVDGKPKTGDALQIAQTIREHREKFGGLFEYVEIKGMFDANALSAKNQILDELMGTKNYADEEAVKASPEYKLKVNDWYRENIRINLTPSFYEERQAITKKIEEITAKIRNEDQRAKLDISEKWKTILNMLKGFRDEDNQPIGTDLTPEQINQVRKLQEEIDEIQSTFNSMNGLTDQEAEEYFMFLGQLAMGERLADDDFEYFQELDRKNKLQLSKEDKKELYKAYEELKALQSKIATPYYVDVVNDFLAKSGSKLRINAFNPQKILTPSVINPILNNNPEFRKWWNANHMLKEKFDKQVQTIVQDYDRIYVWNRIVPNDNLFKIMLENGDYEGLSNYKSKFVDIKKAHEYYYRRLKPEYVNKKSKDNEWITHDNKGHWLPKPTRNSATPEQRKYMEDNGIPYAKDDAFENKKYIDLRDNKKDLFELLEAYKQFHLKTQEDLPRYARLGLEVPRLRKNNVENFDPSKMMEKPQEWWSNIKNWLGALFMRRADDFELGSGSYNPKAQAQTYVLTDLMGDQINSIPIKYISPVDADSVSMDIGKAVSMYATSAEINKVLHEINPVANALKETLSDEDNKPKDVTKKRRNIIKIVQDMFSRTANQSANKKGSYNRLKIISNFLERELEGITNIQQFGATGEKLVNGIMKIGAWGSLGLNVFAALKNDFAGRIQNNLEAVYGEKITPSTLAKSNIEFGKLMQALLTDYYKIGGENEKDQKSLYTQLFLLFDPMNNYKEKVGTDFSKTGFRDALDLKWIMAMQKFGEINIQGSAWLAMMLHQKIKYTDPVTHEETEIPYLQAWEIRSGVVSLKEGVDKKWDKDGKNFLQFTSSLHKVNELNQGAYSDESQPEIARMTLGKLFLFMRKFYVPGAVNRFAPKRYNAALGSFRQGYYIPLLDAIGTAVGSAAKGNILSREEMKAIWSPAERKGMLRALSELGFVSMFGLLILALGFDGDDEDRYQKLKDNSWIHNFLIYQLMMIKSETETFIPMYGMGVNETVRFLGTPSIAFNTARRWVKVGQDFLNWTIGAPEARYERASGIYDEGQLKFIADLLNIVGWKNFSYLSSNEDLQQGLKMYASMQKRI